MFFALSDEQRELQEVLRSFLEDAVPQNSLVERASNGTEAEFDLALTRRLALEMGVLGATMPTDRGGSGLGLLAQFLIFRELGRVLAGSGFLASVLAAEALVRLDPDAVHDGLLQALIGGEKLGAVAGLDWSGTDFTATREAGEWKLSGTSALVLGAADSDVLLVFTGAGEHPTCFLIEDITPVSCTRVDMLDGTRATARIELQSVTAVPLGSPDGDARAYSDLLRIATLCIAAEQLGVAEKAQDIAVEHASIRKQFGAPIGSFQAIKHRCANVAMALDGARNMGFYAAWADEAEIGASEKLVNIAKSVCVEASVSSTENAIQVLGGLGFTWEHPIHLYYRRAISSRQIFGSTRFHREIVARELIDHD